MKNLSLRKKVIVKVQILLLGKHFLDKEEVELLLAQEEK